MRPDVAQARAALAQRLSKKGYVHSVAVAETAAELAEAYGVETEDAYLAGLLHDWSRDVGPDRLLEEARRRGMEITAADEAVPYLLHARVGAAELSEHFPSIPQRVLRAVERHTFGAPEMTDLDRVVYLADALEPGRDTRAARELRAEVGHLPLHELYARAYAASVEQIVRSRRQIHAATVGSWNAIVSGEPR